MSTKHTPTPGPWLVEGTTVYALHGNPPRNRFSALVQVGRRDDASEEEMVANARLMAAAPNLLKELRSTASMLRSACLVITDPAARGWALEQVAAAEAAIVAATGSAS